MSFNVFDPLEQKTDDLKQIESFEVFYNPECEAT